MTKVAVMLAALLIAGCGDRLKDIAQEPHLTPIGAGMRPNRVAVLGEQVIVAPPHRPDQSFWRDSSADLFRDPRAMKVGDVVTVKISIKDKASLDNNTERSRNSKNNLAFDLNYDLKAGPVKGKGDTGINSDIDAKTSSKGEGAITRSESIELLVAAVVTDVLPNGNLVISGTQEVRVNFEVRVLSVAGIVRPRDISTENAVSYDKIAEARISYGGRGRLTEVQQPAWGHQIVDLFSPF